MITFPLSTHSSVPSGARYDFDVVHPVAKQLAFKADAFLFGLEPIGLLLWFGDLKSVQAGIAKLVDGHERILALVREGTATADGYAACSRSKPCGPCMHLPTHFVVCCGDG